MDAVTTTLPVYVSGSRMDSLFTAPLTPSIPGGLPVLRSPVHVVGYQIFTSHSSTTLGTRGLLPWRPYHTKSLGRVLSTWNGTHVRLQ